MNKSGMNLLVYVFMWMYVFIYLEYSGMNHCDLNRYIYIIS
jgi:hypothetical protein